MKKKMNVKGGRNRIRKVNDNEEETENNDDEE